MSMNCPICEGKVSFWSKVTLQDNIEICGDCKSDTNKIYSGFSSNSNEFSLYQVKTLLKKEVEFREFVTKLFKANSTLSDYSETTLRKIFRAINDDKLIHGIFGKHFERGFGTLILTDKRLIFIDAGDYLTFAFKETIALDLISSIDFSLSDNVITITISQKTIKIETDTPEYMAPFCDAVNGFIQNSSKEADTQDYSVSVILDLVERLGKLRQNGILTEDEFSAEKAKLFSKL